jgi:hypothetical protein
MYFRTDLAPEVRKLASEAFNRCWRFIEQDPFLAGADRQGLQDQLAQLILLVMRGGERNLIVIANRAIGTLRQQYATQRVA